MKLLPFLLIFSVFSAYSAECVKCDDYFYGRNGTPQDYKKALELYSADTQNPESMNNAGYILRMGLGTEKDEAKALEFYKKAAEGGDIYGMYNLANLLRQSAPLEAFTAMKNAADKGLPIAMSDLGCMHEKGEGTPQDYTAALIWFGKAAEKGNKYGQHNLGIMFLNGRGVEQNEATAKKWLAMAAAQGLKSGINLSDVKMPPKEPPLSKLITIDKSTGLAWQDNEDASEKEMTWAQADKYCKELSLNGIAGWRMPDAKEMLSLVDTSKSPSVKPIFGNKSSDVYWTSSTNPNDKSSARVVYLFNGADYWSEKSFFYRVRCVRGR